MTLAPHPPRRAPSPRAARPTPAACRWLGAVAALPLLAAAPARAQPAEPPSAAGPVLRCLVRYAADTHRIEARPTAEPYAVAAHDIGTRFRFKAVVVGRDGRVDLVALYAYDMAVPGAPVLIHEVVHAPPFAAGAVVPSLTGWNHVYSSRLGRELVYGCALDAGGAS